MAEEQFIDLSGCGGGHEYVIEEESEELLSEDVCLKSKTDMVIKYCYTNSYLKQGMFELEINLTFDEGGEREFLQRKLS